MKQFIKVGAKLCLLKLQQTVSLCWWLLLIDLLLLIHNILSVWLHNNNRFEAIPFLFFTNGCSSFVFERGQVTSFWGVHAVCLRLSFRLDVPVFFAARKPIAFRVLFSLGKHVLIKFERSISLCRSNFFTIHQLLLRLVFEPCIMGLWSDRLRRSGVIVEIWATCRFHWIRITFYCALLLRVWNRNCFWNIWPGFWSLWKVIIAFSSNLS